MTYKENIESLLEKGEPDFCIHLDFPPNTKNPHRLLSAAGAFIESLQEVDKVLLSSVDTKIKPVFVLEEIEIGSLKLMMKQFLESVSDEDLRKLNWKKAVGNYLVKGKHRLLALMSKTNNRPTRQELEALSRELYMIAQETDVRNIPSYTAVKAVDIAQEMKRISDSLLALESGDSIKFITDDGEAKIVPGVAVTQEEITRLFTDKEIANELERILMVRRPDFLGESKWEFRYEKKSISAKIDDDQWMADYRSAKIDIRPGDALHVRIRESVTYDNTGEVIKNEITVIRVLNIIRIPKEGALL